MSNLQKASFKKFWHAAVLVYYQIRSDQVTTYFSAESFQYFHDIRYGQSDPTFVGNYKPRLRVQLLVLCFDDSVTSDSEKQFS